jgi:type I restriction enzyme S subunit
MSEWKEGMLSQLADIVMGHSPTGETCNDKGMGTPLLNGPTEFTNRYPSAVQFTTDPKRMSEVNDILFCVRGSTTGKMNWSDKEYAIGRGLAAIRHRGGARYQAFMRGLMEYQLPQLLASATGSTFPNISRAQLEEWEVSIPPIEEQESIASVLSSLDAKIDLLHRQNKTLEAMAEMLFRQWFVEEAEEGWHEGTLGEIIEIHDTKRVPLSNLQRAAMQTGKLYPYYGAATIMDQVNDFLFDGEYILLGEDGSVVTEDGYPVLQYATGKFWVNNHAHVLRAKAPYTNRYLWTYLKKKNIADIVTGAVQPKISQGHLKALPIVLPPPEVVESICSAFAPLYAKLDKNIEQTRTLTALRDTLLPKLMSGEVRVELIRNT